MQDLPRYSDLELPQWRCLPAHVAAADQARLAPVAAGVPQRLDPQEVSETPAFRFGADLFNAGFFWEAHEVWEPVWMALPPNSRERTACRALIQGANCCLKLRYGRSNAVSRLAEEVERLAREVIVFGPLVATVNLAQWSADFRSFADGLTARPLVSFGFAPHEVPNFPFVLLDAK